MPSKKNLGRALREVRQHFGLSQDDFAFASSRTFVSSIERGVKSPTIEKLSQLAQVMDTEAVVILLVATLHEHSARAGRNTEAELEAVFRMALRIFRPRAEDSL